MKDIYLQFVELSAKKFCQTKRKFVFIYNSPLLCIWESPSRKLFRVMVFNIDKIEHIDVQNKTNPQEDKITKSMSG